MGSAEEHTTTTTLPMLPLVLFSSVSPPPEPEPSGTLTPPLHSPSAAVPFRWEEEPGKPKHSTAILPFSDPITHSSPKSLELPPRLIILENPHGLGSSTRFRSPSLRMGTDCYGSFGAGRERVGVGVGFGLREKRGWFGSWRMKKKVKRIEGNHVFPSCGADNRETSDVGTIEGTQMKRSGSQSSFTHPRSGFWTRICEGLKQMVPWSSKKLKKDGYALRL